jgi:hypothetical protein
MINFDIKMGGEFKLVITKPDGSVQETDWFDNIILNQGLDRVGSGANTVIAYAQVGTGTSTPVATQVGLDVFLAGSAQQTSPNGGVTNSGSPTYTENFVWFFAFAQGAVVGNITELGVGWSATGNNLFSRALILDNLGSPTSITIVAIDQLTVYYRLKVVPPLTDTTGSVTIGGTPYSYTGRVASVGSFSNSVWTFWAAQIGRPGSLTYPNTTDASAATYGAGSVLGAITGSPTVASGTNGTVAAGAYTPGTFTRDDTWNWSISQGNATGGVQAIMIGYSIQGFAQFQYRFTTVIPKDNTKTMSITTRITWTRI